MDDEGTTPGLTDLGTGERARGMFRELLWVHAHLRRDLATVRRFADAIRAGAPPADLLAQLRDLQTNSPLWRLRYGCLHYCRFVHLHHTIEDAAVFPMVRKHDPSLGRVVDRLEEDHLQVHHLTERIAAEADRLAVDPSGDARAAVAASLADLETLLLEHLAVEEVSLGPLLSSWDHWPTE